MKSLIKASIIPQLADETINDQAIIIYKYLTNAYAQEPLDLPEVVDGIERIQNENAFPVDAVDRTSYDGKYRSFSNLFEQTGSEPNNYTLKFGMAILGIIPIALERKLDPSQEVKEEHSNALTNEEKGQKLNLPKVLGAVLILLVLGILGWMIGRKLLEPEPTEYVTIEEASFSEVFKSSYGIDASDPVIDSLIFYINEVFVLANDSYVVELAVINLSEDAYFVDRISVKNEGTLTPLKVSGTIYQLPDEILTLPLEHDHDRLEFILLNSTPDDAIQPRSESQGLIKLHFRQPLTYDIIPQFALEVHNQFRTVTLTATR